MRTIRTFVLRLLVDTNEPQALQGAVRCIADDEEETFADGPALLDLLRRLSHTARVPFADNTEPPPTTEHKTLREEEGSMKVKMLCLVFSLLLPLALSRGNLQAVAQPTGGVIYLPRTGQTASFYPGDDGALQVGVAGPTPRFTDHGDGSVTDHLTGLMWAQNANLMASRAPAFDTDGTPGDGAVTWFHTLDYLAQLNAESYLGHADWRLPNLVKLTSLLDAGQAHPALPVGHPFTGVQDRYWSSTTYRSSVATAWWVNFQNGAMDFSGASKRFSFYSVWPVRGAGPGAVQLRRTGQVKSYADGDDGDLRAGAVLPNPRFTDHGDGTVSDRLTGLMWSQSAVTAMRPWTQALDYVAGMNAGTNPNLGYTDWRLPNRAEVYSLSDFGQSNPSLPAGHPFDSSVWTPWTSTTYAADTGKAWGVSGLFQYFGPRGKSQSLAVWPVRIDTTPLTGHAISGRVLSNGQGLAGATVALGGPLNGQTTTDSQGYYLFNYLPDGSYTLTPAALYHTFDPPSRSVTLAGADLSGQDLPGHLSAVYGWVDLSDALARPALAPHSNLQFIGQEGWIGGGGMGQGEIYHTTDGGQSFTVLPLGSEGVVRGLWMRSPSEGYAVTSSGEVFRTADGWQHAALLGKPGSVFTAIHFPPLPEATGYACQEYGAIYQVTASGVTYETNISTVPFASLKFPLNSTEGWIVGGNTMRHRTVLGWQDDQNYDSGNSYNAIYMVDHQYGTAVGDSGVIIHTTDRMNWNGQINPDVRRRSLNDVAFVDKDIGWAVGYGGILLHTTNSSGDVTINEWTIEAPGLTEDTLISVFAVDSGTAYAVGVNATLLKYTQLLSLPNRVYLPLVVRNY